MPRLFKHFPKSPLLRGAALIGALFLLISLATRLALLWQSRGDVAWNGSLAASFGFGLFYDLAVLPFVVAPWVLAGMLVPSGWWNRSTGRAFLGTLLSLYSAVLLFNAVAEYFFWDEFQVRYNFIAVDYLVWTQEVWGNIWQSYPMPLIIAGLALGAGAIVFGLRKAGAVAWVCGTRETWGGRLKIFVLIAALGLLIGWKVTQSMLPNFDNQYNRELGKSGLYAFGAAFWEMELDYLSFYPSQEGDRATARCRELLATPSAPTLSPSPQSLMRRVTGRKPEENLNVIVICMESLSADYMAHYGNKKALTPNLDRLADESLFLSRCYATGTRTVRGMEALTLGLPPTPGQAIIYRPNSTGLRTIATPFRDRGYDCAFFYGGDGRFDYMNRYFGGNGFRVVDKNAWKPADITFETSWGACDEDLYRKTISEADINTAQGKPFYFFCMTTSNHRPFQYPDGKIDLPSNSGRKGAVKYHDFAIGQFVEAVKTKPWFADTLFVFVSDHCSSSAGKVELDVTKYLIPAMIWNPSRIPARKYKTLCSQIDVMPTTLGLMNWSYDTLNFGYDLLGDGYDARRERAFVSNYQRIGLMRPGKLGILQPMKEAHLFQCDFRKGLLSPVGEAPELREDAVSWYQSASWLFKSQGLKLN